MGYLMAVVIGVIVGAVGWYLIKDRQANAIWLAPVLGVVGGVIASILASIFGHPGYGWKEAVLQIVLAAVAVGALVYMAKRQVAEPAAPTGPAA